MASDALETLCSEMSEQSRVLINQDAINKGLAAHEAVQAALSLLAFERTPYGWMIQGSAYVYTGEYAETDATAEAKRCGGTCKAFPLYHDIKEYK